MAEWYCHACQRWVSGLCCPGCLKIDPASVRWMSRHEIDNARRKVLDCAR